MLRPERMSKVSVTGSRRVMADVIDALHEVNLLHVRDYDGSWEGFDPGDPTDGAESISEQLVTVRSLESLLGVTEEEAAPAHSLDEETIESRLESVREEVNDLDDRRSELEDELRTIDERIDAVEPFVDLGLDLDLLRGYETIDVAVGVGNRADVEDALDESTDVRAYEVFAGDETVAAFAYPTEDAEDAAEEALVGTGITRIDVPDADGSPAEHLDQLTRERDSLTSELDQIESRLDALRSEHGGFLLAAEERLTIDVQRAEAPLQFATTDHAFVAEGWVPSDEVGDVRRAVTNAADEVVEVEELERASYTDTAGHSHEAVADGGHEVGEDTPPVVQNNPSAAKPFELLVRVLDRPTYSELDPTMLMLLTFPMFFGFMIGDLAYGALYVGIGYLLWSRFDSDAIRSLGGVAIWAGVFTSIFGVLYGEIFGFHVLGDLIWGGHPPLKKGLHTLNFVQLWLTVSLFVGLFHVVVGFAFGFVNDWHAHSPKDAVLEDLSWILLITGLWTWVFSTQAAGSKPNFIFQVLNGDPIPLGFAGFSPTVGTAGLVVALVGFVLVVAGEGVVGLFESPNALVNVISYTRLAAVLVAKAGMAFVVNLLVVGAYEHDGAVHYMYSHGPEYVTQHYGESAVMFNGLIHAGVGGMIAGAVVLVAGHAAVLALGVTSAGLQAVRLEYVECFNKFYDGGGEKYTPFGYRRTYTNKE